MEKSKWSEYAKYLVLTDRSSGLLRGTYTSFSEFKIVKNIINSIAYSDKTTYLYNGNFYKRKITSDEAKIIFYNINRCKWNNTTKKMLLISSQIIVNI